MLVVVSLTSSNRVWCDIVEMAASSYAVRGGREIFLERNVDLKHQMAIVKFESPSHIDECGTATILK